MLRVGAIQLSPTIRWAPISPIPKGLRLPAQWLRRFRALPRVTSVRCPQPQSGLFRPSHGQQDPERFWSLIPKSIQAHRANRWRNRM